MMAAFLFPLFSTRETFAVKYMRTDNIAQFRAKTSDVRKYSHVVGHKPYKNAVVSTVKVLHLSKRKD
jgi:hypothetical protein